MIKDFYAVLFRLVWPMWGESHEVSKYNVTSPPAVRNMVYNAA
jgi:hypothetical protein